MPLPTQQVIVSRRSHETGARPHFVYRDTPLSRSDSGWCVLVGDETAAELDDPSSCLSQSMDAVLDRWPELRPVFECGAQGSEWRWDGAAQQYVAAVQP